MVIFFYYMLVSFRFFILFGIFWRMKLLKLFSIYTNGN